MNKKEPSQEEIQEHLNELNLTTLADARMKRLKWFYEYGIPIVEIETTFYLVPKNIQPKEFVRRMVAVNIEIRFLQIQLDWFKAMGLSLSLGNQLGVPKYVYKGEKQGFDPSKRLEYSETPELYWFIPDQHQASQIEKLYEYITILKKSSLVDLENTSNKEESNE